MILSGSETLVDVATARHQLASAISNVGECPETVLLEFDNPISIVEGLPQAGESHRDYLRQDSHRFIITRLRGRSEPLSSVATLVGALIGAVAVLAGVMIQRRIDRRDKLEAEARRKCAVAKALLFEIKNFYRWYYRHLRPILPPDLNLETCHPPTVSAPTAQLFAVYRANTDTLGTFDDRAVEFVVRFYGLAEWLLATIQEYQTALAFELQFQHSVPSGSAPRKLLKQVQTLMFDTDKAAVNAGRLLANVAEISGDPFATIDD